MRRLSWALARLLILLPLWLIGLVMLLLGLALSPWGTGVLFAQAERLGLLEVESVEGSPLDTLKIEGLRLTAGPASVAVSNFELAWADDCLLHGRLCVDKLAVDGARIRLGASEAADEPAPEESAGGPPGPIQLPLPLALRELALNDVEVRLADGTRLRWQHFESGAEAQGSALTLSPTRLVGLRLTPSVSPGNQLALSEAERSTPVLTAQAIDAAVAARSPLPASVAPTAAGVRDSQSLPLDQREPLTLPDVTLPLAVNVPSLTLEDAAFEGPQAYVIDRLDLSVTARDQTVTIHPLAVASREADATLEAEVTLSGDYPLEAHLGADFYLPERLPALAGQRLELALTGDLRDLSVSLTASGPMAASLQAHLDALDPTLPFSARLQSEALQWPLPGAAAPAEDATNADASAGETADPAEPWKVENLDLDAEGSLTDYRLSLGLSAQGPSLPRTDIAMDGQGNLQRFDWAPLMLTPPEGTLTSEGRVDWSRALSVSARLDVDGFDPEPFVEGLAGRLDGKLQLAFSQTADGWRLGVPTLAVDGTLADQPFSLSGQLSGDHDMNWDIASLSLRQGDNRLDASGQVAPSQLNLDAQLDMPHLDTLYPGLAGALSGDIDASGSFEQPQLSLALNGNRLAFGGNRLARLRLTGKVEGLDDPSLDVSLDADDVAAGGQAFDAIALALDGRLSEHRLTLDVQGDPDGPLSSLSLALEGALDQAREHYRGRLTPLEADTAYGRLGLDEALAFDADLTAGAVEVEPFCLTRAEGGGLCLTAPLSASPDRGRAELAIRELPMDLINDALPPGWRIDGATEGDLVAAWSQGGGAWQARANLDSRVKINGEDAYGQPWSVPGTELSVTLDADQARADLGLRLRFGDQGALRLDLGIGDPMGAGRLDGRFRVDDVQLAPYRPLVADLDTLDGALAGAIDIGGDRDRPRLDGRLELAGLRAEGLGLPLSVTDGQLAVDLAGDSADINGYVTSEEGRMNITGDASWPSSRAWRAALNLEGREAPLLVAMPGFGRLHIAPDLRIRANPERLQVRGEVAVPWARLEVGKVPPSAVSPSPDEVIVTREEAEAADRSAAAGEPGTGTAEAMQKAGMALDVQVDLVLGPDMRLEAYGLETKLAGDLQVAQSDGPVQLFGNVNLEDGRFRAFGQDLIIRQGILYFSGPPGQPLLDFEAIRNPDNTEDDVIAGLRVSGPAANPSLEIFSEPSMDEARALSYALRGRAPDDSSGADGALTSALIGVTLGQAGGAVGSIGEAFGIDDLSLDTAGSGDESQVVVTGNLTDRLSVGYGVGVFSPIAELTLRYKLWRDLYLEAVSGASQAVDLIYTFSLPGDPPAVTQ
ncbi:autotransporter assembly complex protein TamB [Halomonas getboli]|uniref:autotransporter assembly complex protein TamB n=1 Tax=Halomonas getboli TaxID=2935862 RepID=UPI0020003734|nr:translocation/assembly module TamB domain-containing protein [Halomonas getboli]MCK2183185.1 translocation/assembly module TamB [Halomonas getboli]